MGILACGLKSGTAPRVDGSVWKVLDQNYDAAIDMVTSLLLLGYLGVCACPEVLVT